MATNLRLRPAAETALRERSQNTGVSQQQLIREAVDQFLGLSEGSGRYEGSIDELIARGLLKPATPFRQATKLLKLPDGVRSEDLLNRDDRV